MWSPSLRFVVAVSAAAAVAGCSMQRGPAEDALAAADSALQASAADAKAYVPDQFTALGDQLTAARADFDARDYGEALIKAQDVTTKLGELGAAIATKKAELTQTWTGLSESLPGMVKAVETRVGELSRMRRLPAGVTAASVDGAKAAVASMTSAWAQAQEAFGAGNLTQAVSLANGVKASADSTLAALGAKKM